MASSPKRRMTLRIDNPHATLPLGGNFVQPGPAKYELSPTSPKVTDSDRVGLTALPPHVKKSHGRSALDDPYVPIKSDFGIGTPGYHAAPKIGDGYIDEKELKRRLEEKMQAEREKIKNFNKYTMLTKLKPMPWRQPRAPDAHMPEDTPTPPPNFKLTTKSILGGYSDSPYAPPGKFRIELPALEFAASKTAAEGPNTARLPHIPNPPRVPSSSHSTTDAHGLPSPPNPYQTRTFGQHVKIIKQNVAPLKPRRSVVSLNEDGTPILVVRELGSNLAALSPTSRQRGSDPQTARSGRPHGGDSNSEVSSSAAPTPKSGAMTAR